MHRFYITTEVLKATTLRLTGETAQQITRVLRMRVGDRVVLFDGQGYDYIVRLSEFGKDEIQCEVLGRDYGRCEPSHQVDLYLALLNKPDKLECALQKCTELGASRFVPVTSERTVAGPPEQGRRERWERIIAEAAEQSGRTILPLLDDTITLKQAIKQEAKRLDEAEGIGHLALMPALGADLSLSDALSELDENSTVSLFIGPEGGFSDDELYEADRHGVQLVNLGPRTLRAETAAVAALTIVMHELGEMGGSPNTAP